MIVKTHKILWVVYGFLWEVYGFFTGQALRVFFTGSITLFYGLFTGLYGFRVLTRFFSSLNQLKSCCCLTPTS